MEKILFKGKRVGDHKWIEGFYVCLGDKYHYILTGKLDITKGYPDFVHYEVIPETVCQFTGLTDKNGKKIFKGDIVKEELKKSHIPYLAGRTLKERKHIGLVKFGEYAAPTGDPWCWGGAYGFYIDGEVSSPYIPEYAQSSHRWELEVIGNIHDNPELLEGVEMEVY